MNNLEILIRDLLRDVNKFSVLNRVHRNYTLFTLDFWKYALSSRCRRSLSLKATSINERRKSFLANVHKRGFNSGGTNVRATSKRCTQTERRENSKDGLWSCNMAKKNGNQHPANITTMISKTLRPRHSWRRGRCGCRKEHFRTRSVFILLNEM